MLEQRIFTVLKFKTTMVTPAGTCHALLCSTLYQNSVTSHIRGQVSTLKLEWILKLSIALTYHCLSCKFVKSPLTFLSLKYLLHSKTYVHIKLGLLAS